MLCRLIRRLKRSLLSPIAGVVVSSLTVATQPASAQTPPQTTAAVGAASPIPSNQPAAEPPAGQSSRELRLAAISAVPMDRLTPAARQRISSIVERPTLYRHLPPQTLDCDAELFIFLARQPEVLVGIWEVMGITQVKTERLDEYRMRARDGAGTTCTIDLVYGDKSTHIYVADGFYDGKLVAAPITGKGVFILRTHYEPQADGQFRIHGTLDCFVQLDNLGADLIARTFGPLIGRTADNNFTETAKFINQIGMTARNNPEGLAELGGRLPQVTEPVRQRFVETIYRADTRYRQRVGARAIARSAESDMPSLPLR